MNVTITVDDQYDLDEVASQIEAAGGSIRNKLRSLSVLTATLPEDSIPMLQRIEGVRDVKKEQNYFAT